MFDEKYISRIEEKVFAEAMELINQGKKVIGTYCAFTPEEVIAAAGAIPVSLCAGSIDPIESAEKHLPRNLCPLIKASYGHAIDDTCPYFHCSDFIFADATCDGKKKMFELLKRIKPLHLLQLPQTYDSEESVIQWENEIKKIIDKLEVLTKNKIKEEDLKKQIRLYNKYRKTVKSVFDLNKGEVPLLYGREIDAILNGGGFSCNLDKRIAEIEDAIEIIKQREYDELFLNEMKKKPRILITGCPITNKKLLDIIEDSGAVVVAMENCGALKTVYSCVDENKEPIKALSEYYVKTACPCMTPNKRRFEIIKRIIDEYKIHGVVELTWQACHTYNVEAYQIKEFVNNELNKPYIQIETDYTENDKGQIKVRIEAYLELL